MNTLHSFGEEIWTLDGPRVRMLTIPFSTRMTVVRLQSGGLWVHSPIELTEECRASLESLGAAEHVIAPNKIHSLGVGSWKESYPSTQVWVSPRFSERHPTLTFDQILESESPEDWRGQIDQLVFGGSSFFDEVVFFHRPSKTLIVTDLIQRHDPKVEPWFWRVVKGAAGVLGEGGGTARDLRKVYKDRDAARLSAQKVLSWDFDRVIISHGLCITENAREVVEAAFAWVLER